MKDEWRIKEELKQAKDERAHQDKLWSGSGRASPKYAERVAHLDGKIEALRWVLGES